MRPLAIALCSLLLAACTTPEERAERAAKLEAADHAECVELGFTKGTADYGNCRLRLREMRQRERALRQPDYGVGFGWGHGYRASRAGMWF